MVTKGEIEKVKEELREKIINASRESVTIREDHKRKENVLHNVGETRQQNPK